MPRKGLNEFVEQIGEMTSADDCWVWASYTGGGKNGQYGRFIYESVGNRNKRMAAHRWGYQEVVEKLSDEMTLDHLCGNPLCVNPDHLEPCSQAENNRRGQSPSAENARKTHCIRNHELAGWNLYVTPDGRRQCKTCRGRSHA